MRADSRTRANYKPHPPCTSSVDYLGYRPHEILMVACQQYDLKAARAFGCARRSCTSAGVRSGRQTGHRIGGWFDLYADSFVALAQPLALESA